MMDIDVYPYAQILYPPFVGLEIRQYNVPEVGFYHSHAYAQCIAVTVGEILFLRENGAEIPLRQGDLLIVPVGRRHSWIMGEKTCRAIQIYHQKLNLAQYGELAALFGGNNHELLKLSIPAAEFEPVTQGLEREILVPGRKNGMLIHARLLELFALASNEFTTPEPTGENRMRQVGIALKYIEEHLRERITVAELAHRCNLSPSRFAHIFTECTGKSPVRYINELRIERASKLLLFSRMNVSEVASYYGFESIHYFSRLFRRIAGHTPSECLRNK